ncbi:hypothetical protein [Histidinibacterium aquaticum]|uniref:Uncharacterized protein n=1 Tax=Histidinibacterium aquaticum TaxID=2613962 RepID=A0A5J5GAR1_9RHOB|nr:hypothetical protein [Histidinibacterium aquaticum]KAA9005071.1 hypothetical protein F3S47_18760 [Histidinibacterium aquaticum]
MRRRTGDRVAAAVEIGREIEGREARRLEAEAGGAEGRRSGDRVAAAVEIGREIEGPEPVRGREAGRTG